MIRDQIMSLLGCGFITLADRSSGHCCCQGYTLPHKFASIHHLLPLGLELLSSKDEYGQWQRHH
jgi:hypothetical protein